MPLNSKQKRQVALQLQYHRHRRYEVDIKLDQKYELRKFVVYKHVIRPEIMTSLHLSRYLYFHPDSYIGKRVIDMGSGSGLQGVIMGLCGANHVIFSDIANQAVKNTTRNVAKFKLKKKSTIVPGDLFEKIKHLNDFRMQVGFLRAPHF